MVWNHDKLGFLTIGITVIILHKFGFKFYNPNSSQYVEKIMDGDGHNNLKFEWYNRNLNSE